MFKKSVSLLCAAVLSASFAAGLNVSASVIESVSPAYVYAYDCVSELTISGSTATCTSSVVGISGTTTKIIIKQILQKKNSSGGWDDVCSWIDNSFSTNFTLTNYKYSLSSGTYRLKSEFTIYSGTSSETDTKYGY